MSRRDRRAYTVNVCCDLSKILCFSPLSPSRSFNSSDENLPALPLWPLETTALELEVPRHTHPMICPHVITKFPPRLDPKSTIHPPCQIRKRSPAPDSGLLTHYIVPFCPSSCGEDLEKHDLRISTPRKAGLRCYIVAENPPSARCVECESDVLLYGELGGGVC